MVVPIADLGNEARSNLTPFAEPVLIKRRTVALIVLCVVYHLPLLWRNRAALLMGCLGVFRTSTGTGSDEAVAARWAASARRFLRRFDARMAFLACVLVGLDEKAGANGNDRVFRFAYFIIFKAIGAHIPLDGAMIDRPYVHQGKPKVV